MDSIFSNEGEIVLQGEELLKNANGTIDAKQYEFLLDEYKKMLKQMRRVVSISDRMQFDLKKLSGQLEQMSKTDVLTGLYNRRFFNEILQKEWDSAVRSMTRLAALMIDVDYFKKFNDLYGHLAGDGCLHQIATALKQSIQRPRDFVARYGGEEFFVILPETDLIGAIFVANNILEQVRALQITHAGNDELGIVSVSIGVAWVRPTLEMSATDLLMRVDEALFRAKANGRDRWNE